MPSGSLSNNTSLSATVQSTGRTTVVSQSFAATPNVSVGDLNNLDETGLQDGYYIVYDSATSGYKVTQLGNANGAFDKANSSFDHANAAFDVANTGLLPTTIANAAFDKANSNFVFANNAFHHANAAFVVANTKLSAAGGNITGDITIAGNIIPSLSNTFNLGSESVFWRDLYLSGSTLFLGGTKMETDPVSGGVVFIPKPTNKFPNPKALFISAEGRMVSKRTSAGKLTPQDFAEANSKAATDDSLSNEFISDSSNTANASFTHANAAFVHSSSSFDKANSNFIFANNAFHHANAAFDAGNTNATNITTNQVFANNAFHHANSAYAAANSGGGGGGLSFVEETLDANTINQTTRSLSLSVSPSVNSPITRSDLALKPLGVGALVIKPSKQANLSGAAANTTGGTQVISGGYAYHFFNSSGTFVLSEQKTVTVYAVAGGGAGGGVDTPNRTYAGGGGGGGGVVQTNLNDLAAGSYAVAVGAGGAGGTSSGANGTNSTFHTVIAEGGGGGGTGFPVAVPGMQGGSGGGGGSDETNIGAGAPSFPSPLGFSQGQPGGAGSATGVYAAGGGGGGYGGQNPIIGTKNADTTFDEGNKAGNGDRGRNIFPSGLTNILPPSIHSFPSLQEFTGRDGRFGGGGGGGATMPNMRNSGGHGGHGGGGGGQNYNGRNRTSGLTNTGGGGGGGSGNPRSTRREGASGGSGLVVLRYPMTNPGGVNKRGQASVDLSDSSLEHQIALGNYSVKIGGQRGIITSRATNSFLGGGAQNYICDPNSGVVAGFNNEVLEHNSFIGAGENNTSGAEYNVTFGQNNQNYGYAASVSGGQNYTNGSYTYAQGLSNKVTNNYSAALSGRNHEVGGESSAVASGDGNEIHAASQCFVGGGSNNHIFGSRNTILGGFGNRVGKDPTGSANFGSLSSVINGNRNQSYATYSFIGNGEFNVANANYSVVLSGSNNTANNQHSVILGGLRTRSRGQYNLSFGYQSVNDQGDSVVLGSEHTAYFGGSHNMLIGGTRNLANSTSQYSAVVAGRNNSLESDYSVILGGRKGLTDLYGYHGSAVIPGHYAATEGFHQQRYQTLLVRTTNANISCLTLNGANGFITTHTASSTVMWGDHYTIAYVEGTCVAHADNADRDYKSWKFEGLVRKNQIGTPLSNPAFTVTEKFASSGASSWDLSVDIVTSISGFTWKLLRVRATGEAGKNIAWIAKVESTEMNHETSDLTL